MTFEIGTWAIPLFITIILFAWTFSIKESGSYDFSGALAFMFSLAVSVTAWIMWGIMKVFGG